MCNAHSTPQQSLNPDHYPGELHRAYAGANGDAHTQRDIDRCSADRCATNRTIGHDRPCDYTPDPIDAAAPGGHVSRAPYRHTLRRE